MGAIFEVEYFSDSSSTTSPNGKVVLTYDVSLKSDLSAFLRAGQRFALAPLAEGKEPEAKGPPRKLTPAERLHRQLIEHPDHAEKFRHYLGLPPDSASAEVHEAVKGRLHYRSLAEQFTEADLSTLTRGYNRYQVRGA